MRTADGEIHRVEGRVDLGVGCSGLKAVSDEGRPRLIPGGVVVGHSRDVDPGVPLPSCPVPSYVVQPILYAGDAGEIKDRREDTSRVLATYSHAAQQRVHGAPKRWFSETARRAFSVADPQTPL